MFTLISESDVDYLPFISLRSTSNVVKKSLPPADDSISSAIDIPAGFAFGNTTMSTVYVRAIVVIHQVMVILIISLSLPILQ